MMSRELIAPITPIEPTVPAVSEVKEASPAKIVKIPEVSLKIVGRDRFITYKRSASRGGSRGSRSRKECPECSKGLPPLNHKCNTTFLPRLLDK